MTRLQDQHAFVTGGGTGIGAAIAKTLAGEGAKVTLVGRRKDKLEEVAEQIRSSRAKSRGAGTEAGKRASTALGTNDDVMIAVADVTSRDDVEAALGIARAAHGPISLLVNNAGAATTAPFAKLDVDDWRAMIAVNLDAVFHCCQAALPDLLAVPRGRIITIASIAGLQGFAYTAAYVAAKHGAVGLMRTLALEFADSGLTANAICPGFTDTDIVAQSVARLTARTGRSDAEARADLAALNPGGRLIAPEEVAAMVVDLCLSDRNGEAVVIA